MAACWGWLLARLAVCFLGCKFGFSHVGFWSGNFFLIVPFPDHCLLAAFSRIQAKCRARGQDLRYLIIIIIIIQECHPIFIFHQ